jgi:hypothetical protein
MNSFSLKYKKDKVITLTSLTVIVNVCLYQKVGIQYVSIYPNKQASMGDCNMVLKWYYVLNRYYHLLYYPSRWLLPFL